MRRFSIRALDGSIGRVSEWCFDDQQWLVRYLVADLGRWLPGKKVLLAPVFLGPSRRQERVLPVSLTLEQVRTSPAIATDMPIALQRRLEERRHYGWELYWAGEAMLGLEEAAACAGAEPRNENGKRFDPHLRTTRIVTGFRLEAADGSVGRVVDFIVDEVDWSLPYLVIGAGARSQVFFPTHFVDRISFGESRVYTRLRGLEIARIEKAGPPAVLAGER